MDLPPAAGQRDAEYGRTKAGKGTKRTLVTDVTDGNGIPVGLVLSQPDRAEIRLAVATMEQVRVPRRRGRPRNLIADKEAYDYNKFRTKLRRKGVTLMQSYCERTARGGARSGMRSTRKGSPSSTRSPG